MVAMAPALKGQRDVAVTALVGVAHYSSHVMQLALPPLFPILHDEFALSFTQLGLIVTLFYIASGLGQAAAGILVDRYGAQRLLVAGITVLSLVDPYGRHGDGLLDAAAARASLAVSATASFTPPICRSSATA